MDGRPCLRCVWGCAAVSAHLLIRYSCAGYRITTAHFAPLPRIFGCCPCGTTPTGNVVATVTKRRDLAVLHR